MKTLTLEQHRARIDNINRAELRNRTYFRRHRVRDYLCGQAVYTLGDYPYPFSIEPEEYDFATLKAMAEGGVDLIQIHEEWNDSIRIFGADKYTSHDPKGLQRFIDLCHSFGIKVIPYTSTGYFHEYDRDFREEFAPHGHRYCCIGSHFKYRMCSAGSAEWREYLIPRTLKILDDYNFDGLYNDWGADSQYFANGRLQRAGCPDGYDPEVEDLLGTIYAEVKRRGGVYKLHCDGNAPAPCMDKVYDYLWIGELVSGKTAGAGKDFPDYVVPCQDKTQLKTDDPDYYFAAVIPFMQFPFLTTMGRPLMGKRIEADVTYYGNENGKYGHEWLFNKAVGDWTKAHPDGPFVHSLWSSIPDDPTEFSRWSHYMSLYKPMVAENSVVYVELSDCADIVSSLPEDVYASMFVNEETYMVVSNLQEGKPYTLVLDAPWENRETGETSATWTIEPNKILFLRRV